MNESKGFSDTLSQHLLANKHAMRQRQNVPLIMPSISSTEHIPSEAQFMISSIWYTVSRTSMAYLMVGFRSGNADRIENAPTAGNIAEKTEMQQSFIVKI
jgi:hypothetical protein